MGDIDLCRAVAMRVGLDRSVLRVILAFGRPPIRVSGPLVGSSLQPQFR